MGYAEDYLAVADALVTHLRETPELAYLATVMFGEKRDASTVSLPAVFIVPVQDNIDLASAYTMQHNYQFRVWVVTKAMDAEEGLKDAIGAAGDVYDALLADPRTLNGAATDVKVARVRTDRQWREAFVLHQAEIELVVEKMRRVGYVC